MNSFSYTSFQQEIIDLAIPGKYFFKGIASNGKTTTAVGRLGRLLSRIPGNQILIFVPQRNLGQPYLDYFSSSRNSYGVLPSVLTIGGFARRMVDLFWPLISEETGFEGKSSQPFFLSLETAEYCMEKALFPLLQQGFFQSIVIEKHRLYSQIIDNLNKSAIIQFPLSEISERLKSVNQLDASLKIAYDQVQKCAEIYRAFLFENNLIDYALLLEIFSKHIFNKEFFNNHFFSNYRALVAENIEEDVPLFHEFLKSWLPSFESATLIFDDNGGYRTFLGADPESASSLADFCDSQFDFSNQKFHSDSFKILTNDLSACILNKKIHRELEPDHEQILTIQDYHFYPEMIKDVCLKIDNLINNEKIPASEIVILSPYLSDSLNFSLMTILEQKQIFTTTSRPSRKYLDDPVIRSMLTLTKIAYPEWGFLVSKFDVRNMLLVLFPGMDIIRADLISQTLFKITQDKIQINSFDQISNADTRNKITYLFGEKIESLRQWILKNKTYESQPLDVFLSQIYGEILSQPGFGFFADFSAANTISKMILSIKNFRSFATQFLGLDHLQMSIEYIKTMDEGLIPSAIFYPIEENNQSVFIAPAHTFLMQNRSSQYQFWLDVGNLGWWERLNQPLTHPYLLSHRWKKGIVWTIQDEFQANQSAMLRVVQGLLNRCKEHVFISYVHTNEHGTEQRGPLLRAFQSLQKQYYHFEGMKNV